MISDGALVTDGHYQPFKVVLEREILGHQDGLAIFLDHVKIIRRVDFSLKEDAAQCGAAIMFGSCCAQHVK